MIEPTPTERESFVWLQGRMVELLLRYDVQRFDTTFGEQQADIVADPRIQRYRDLAVLFYLRDDLFSSILPHIKRCLSFDVPREMQTEMFPPRGQIDWVRTSIANLREQPGEYPLTVRTRQRRRHFATPENLLTVITLLEYRATAQGLLDADALQNRIQSVRHPLHDIVTICTRELTFPQFAGLTHECEAIINGQAPHMVDDLTEAVKNNLMPGHNSAYNDLLVWRERLAHLQLLDRTTEQETPMLGSDPKRDNYLYQIWLFYEIGDMLHHTGCLKQWDKKTMQLTFTWGTDEAQRTYHLQHDRGIQQHWLNAPGVRPDLYIVHADRQDREVRDGNDLIWREPGFLLDAKYYRPRTSPRAPGDPIKRMIADMHLTGEQYGALLFAFQHATPDEEGSTDVDDTATSEPDINAVAHFNKPLYTIMPSAIGMQSTLPDMRVGIWRVQPIIESGVTAVQKIIHSLLEHVHQALKDRVEIRCQGIFLDSLSANAHGLIATASDLLKRDGTALENGLDDVLICPKPHVGLWRVDLVSLQRDCCSNPHMCHVMHQDGACKPQRLTTLQEVTDAIRVSEEINDPAEQIAVATRQVLVTTQRYAALLQPDIAHYHRWVLDELDMGQSYETTPLLNETQRETLALARFLWEQIEHIRASNFAAPTLLFTGVLEEVTHRTIYERCRTLRHANTRLPLQKTLGTLGNSKERGGYNWVILDEDIVQRNHWNEQITEQQMLSFSEWIDKVKSISSIRNTAAHRARVDRREYQSLVQLYFGGATSGCGVLNGLLLAWRR